MEIGQNKRANSISRRAASKKRNLFGNAAKNLAAEGNVGVVNSSSPIEASSLKKAKQPELKKEDSS